VNVGHDGYAHCLLMEYEEHERNYRQNQKDSDKQKSPMLVKLLRHPVTDYLRSVARSRDLIAIRYQPPEASDIDLNPALDSPAIQRLSCQRMLCGRGS
jgi:hypothetical protein